MELKAQKYLRLLLPGIFLYGLLVTLCWTTRWCDLPIPTKIEEVSKLLASIFLGFLYSMTSLREISNRCYHFDVNSNICRSLTEPFKGKITGVEKLTWNQIRHVFYHFIDNDETLKVKSSIIRFNGLVWTSIADFRVVAMLGVLIFSAAVVCSYDLSLSALKFQEHRAGVPIFLLTVLFLITFYFSRVVTNRHKNLGDEQCEYILAHYKKPLEESLRKLLNQG